MNYPVYTGMKRRGPALVEHLGFVAMALAFPLFLMLPFGLEGYLVGAVLFAANRLAGILTDRLARGKMQVTAVGITGIGFISRAWITFGLLFMYAEFVSRSAGLIGAVSFLAYFTVDITARSVAHVAGGGLRNEEQT